MYYKQLLALIRRNFILKKRSVFATCMEILIPAFIIILIANICSGNSYINYYYDIKNQKNLNIEENFLNNENVKKSEKIEINFAFPPEFDQQSRNVFLENIKNNKYIQETTICEDYECFYSYERDEDNYHYNKDHTDYYYLNEKGEKYKNIKLKLNAYDSEKDLFNDKRKKDNEGENIGIVVIGVVFESPTKYAINFDFFNYLSQNLKNMDGILGSQYENEIKMIADLNLIINKSLIKLYSNTDKDITIYSKIMDRKFNKKIIVKHENTEMIGVIMIFYFIPCICNLMNYLVYEKESKIKESLIMIGLKRSIFWISWVITYGIILLITSIAMFIVIKLCMVFVNVSLSLFIVITTTYGISCCCLSFFFSTFIKKTKTSNIVSIIIILAWFGSYIISLIIENNESLKTILGLFLPPIPFYFSIDYITKLENGNFETSFSNIFTNATLRKGFLCQVFSILFYLLISIYLDNIIPQGNNFYRKWYFIFTDIFNYFKKEKIIIKGDNYNKDKNNNQNKQYIQEDPQNQKLAVEVKNIVKCFNVKGEINEVLKNISFNGYYDEIFAILGHNGAGKTTLINIMTGILSATSGEVYYDGMPIKGNETEISKYFGFCPQFDTLDNHLTVEEHVKLYASIKNLKIDTDEIIKDIDLFSKKDAFPYKLSGGQKRKLCITLALLGSPKYVFLDEPTTGLDPYSRKSVWELLSRKKKDRIIFITTHYMDEADYLADRKMITSNGVITCLGTSLFLKTSFNMNYSLDIHIEESKDCCIPDDIFNKYCPDAISSKKISKTNIHVHQEHDSTTKNSNNNTLTDDFIITYLLPMKYSKMFKDIFEEINGLIKNENNSIKNFSITAPSLEELFVKLENYDENQQIKNSAVIDIDTDTKKMNDFNGDDNCDNDYENNEKSTEENKLNPLFNKNMLNKASTLKQIYSIFKIRVKAIIRNKSFVIFYVLLPIIVMFIIILAKKKLEDKPVKEETEEDDSLHISPNIYISSNWFRETTSTNEEAISIINNIKGVSLSNKEYKKDLSFNSSSLVGDSKFIGGFGMNNTEPLNILIYYNSIYYFSLPIAVNLLSNGILKHYKIDKEISVDYKPFSMYSYYDEDDEDDEDDEYIGIEFSKEMKKLDTESIIMTGIAVTLILSLSIFGPLTVKEREEGITHQMFLNGTKKISYWIGVLLSDAICFILPIIVMMILGWIMNEEIFSTNAIPYTFTATFLWTFSSLLCQYIMCFIFNKYDKASSVCIIINPIISFLIGFIAMFIIPDSEYNYFVNKIGDSNEIDVNSKLKTILYIVTMIYSPTLLVLIYQKLSAFIIYYKLFINDDDIASFMNSSEANTIIENKYITNAEKINELSKAFFKSRSPNLSDILTNDRSDSFINLLLLSIGLMVIYLFILYLCEKKRTNNIRKELIYSEHEREELDKLIESGPRDVYNEWKRVENSIKMNDDNNYSNKYNLKIYNAIKDFQLNDKEMETKLRNDQMKSNNEINNNDESAFEKMDKRIIYDKDRQSYLHRIVGDVSFGINKGECLGLLGPNGAGKTTTISLITGVIPFTHGTVYYGDKDLKHADFDKLLLGYCSQKNSLWKHLTVKETIQFYLNISGYPSKDINKYTKYLLESCDIERFANKKIGSISGGTKRKLSFIISICSSPDYLILDEPSAGMDPFTRRFMWKLIIKLKKLRKTSILLTTHSTEEAEALSDRIAILIKGRLVCIDSPESIKMNHSNNYILEVYTNDLKTFEEEYVKKQNIFGLKSENDYVVESSYDYHKFNAKMKIENISNVFSLMEKAKEEGLINQYNFGQYSLEQVFLNFINNF